MSVSIEEIQEKLRVEFKGNRFSHTLGVQYTSICLAMRYGADLKKAELAGLLHDCAKQLPESEMISICETYGEEISEFEYMHPFLLHGKAGACVAQKEYGINDTEVLDAMRYHTTGRPEMTQIEEIVFVADYIEPGRKHAENLDMLRQMAFVDLKQTVLIILEQTLDYLKRTDAAVDQSTVVTRDYYKALLRSKNHE